MTRKIGREETIASENRRQASMLSRHHAAAHADAVAACGSASHERNGINGESGRDREDDKGGRRCETAGDDSLYFHEQVPGVTLRMRGSPCMLEPHPWFQRRARGTFTTQRSCRIEFNNCVSVSPANPAFSARIARSP
ncbi:hypothetical protein HN011_001438 [Eciton burchellii]|nr:hypothetical protein HN011_001438 [Eciton burchellii]